MKRECGDCSVCCVVGSVPELSKPAHTPCIFLKECKKGCCSIFDKPELPDVCRNYECSWKRGFGGEDDKPNMNNIMFTFNEIENQKYFTAIETEEGAIKKAKRMVLDIAIKTHIPIIVCKYKCNDTGDWIIITERTLPRCRRIAGDEIYRYDVGVAMYELLKGKDGNSRNGV